MNSKNQKCNISSCEKKAQQSIAEFEKSESVYLDIQEKLLVTSESGFPEDVIKAFVVMPFGEKGEYSKGQTESNHVFYEIICPSIIDAANKLEARIKVMREVDRNEPGSITSNIINSIAESDLVIADLTGRNPNVFLELGIRYSLRNKTTILIAQEGTDVPFDIKGYKYVEYNSLKIQQARRLLSSFVIQGLSGNYKSDSIVFDTFDEMSVTIPNILESHGPKITGRSRTMHWGEYIKRIQTVIRLLQEPIRNGSYTPDAIIGISNGGLIVSDLIGRELFQGKPILSLWANRSATGASPKYWFFDSIYNRNMLETLKKESLENHPQYPVRVLLVDDHLGTGTTAGQAREFLKECLGEDVRILFLPLFARREESVPHIEDILPYSYKDGTLPGEEKLIFNISKEEFVNGIKTESLYFPYLNKELHKGR